MMTQWWALSARSDFVWIRCRHWIREAKSGFYCLRCCWSHSTHLIYFVLPHRSDISVYLSFNLALDDENICYFNVYIINQIYRIFFHPALSDILIKFNISFVTEGLEQPVGKTREHNVVVIREDVQMTINKDRYWLTLTLLNLGSQSRSHDILEMQEARNVGFIL